MDVPIEVIEAGMTNFLIRLLEDRKAGDIPSSHLSE